MQVVTRGGCRYTSLGHVRNHNKCSSIMNPKLAECVPKFQGRVIAGSTQTMTGSLDTVVRVCHNSQMSDSGQCFSPFVVDGTSTQRMLHQISLENVANFNNTYIDVHIHTYNIYIYTYICLFPCCSHP